MFTLLYHKVKNWSLRPDADKYLFALSFAESSFFPVPPDVLLAPMCATRPHRAMYLAAMTTLFSVAGGVAGYAIGYFAVDLISSWLEEWHYTLGQGETRNFAFDLISSWLEGGAFREGYEQARAWFDQWGAGVVVIAGFSPIPYKIFTIAAGVLEQNFMVFVVASLVGRGARFFLVALLLRWAGPKILPAVERRVHLYGWLTVAAFSAAILLYYWI